MSSALLESRPSLLPVRPVEKLSELFFERFFYNDLISSEDDPQLAAANTMAILAFPGMLCLYFIPKYYVELARATPQRIELSVLGDRFLWLAFEMAVLGLLATLQWDRLFPDRRDYAVLGPQPVTTRVLFEAQARALGRFLGFFLLIVNAGCALFFPIGAVPWKAGMGEGLMFAVGHWIGMAAAGLFVVLTVTALQGLLANALRPRALERASPLVQFGLSAFFVTTIILLPLLWARLSAGYETVGELVQLNPLTYWLPPLWFAGLAEWLAGRGGETFSPLAATALLGLAGAAAAATGGYLLSYRRFLTRSLESARSSFGDGLGARHFVRVLTRQLWPENPSERAVYLFTLRTLARSPKHRVYLGAFLAAGTAIAFARLWGVDSFAALDPRVLAQPYVVLFMLLAGLRAVFALPAELPANWIFRFHGGAAAARYALGYRRAIWTAGAVPLIVLTTATVAQLWGGSAGGVHLLLWGVVCWISIEAALIGFHKIPFTCNYLPGRAHVIGLWTFYAIAMLAYSSTLAEVEIWTLADLLRPAFLALAALLGWVLWRRFRCLLERSRTEVVFFESDDPVVQRLGLEP